MTAIVFYEQSKSVPFCDQKIDHNFLDNYGDGGSKGSKLLSTWANYRVSYNLYSICILEVKIRNDKQS